MNEIFSRIKESIEFAVINGAKIISIPVSFIYEKDLLGNTELSKSVKNSMQELEIFIQGKIKNEGIYFVFTGSHLNKNNMAWFDKNARFIFPCGIEYTLCASPLDQNELPINQTFYHLKHNLIYVPVAENVKIAHPLNMFRPNSFFVEDLPTYLIADISKSDEKYKNELLFSLFGGMIADQNVWGSQEETLTSKNVDPIVFSLGRLIHTLARYLIQDPSSDDVVEKKLVTFRQDNKYFHKKIVGQLELNILNEDK